MEFLLLFVVSYLLGSIPTGVVIGKKYYQVDIREHGSGNTGSTNTFRVLGKKAGIIVLLIDILKGTLPAALAIWCNVPIHPIFVGIFAILGHTFSIFAQFKGGKAVATSAGVVLAIYPLFILSGAGLFLILLYFTRMVSLSSMVTACVLALCSLAMNDWIFSIVAICIASFIVYRHRSNITRIKDGTESKVPFGFKK